MVRWPLRPAGEVPELVIIVTTATTMITATTALSATTVSPGTVARSLGRAAVKALLDEVNLVGKPGLVGPESARGHSDMDASLMRDSARSLQDTFTALAELGAEVPVGQELRDALGRIGRAGEHEMMTVTGGVNTHRGAIWNLGLHVTATAGLLQQGTPATSEAITERAGSIASFQDSILKNNGDAGTSGAAERPGARARRTYRVGGALSEAAGGFPHVRRILDAFAHADALGLETDDRHLHGLLTCMGSLVDTCLLHRGGMPGLDLVRTGAAAVAADTVCTGRLDQPRVRALDARMTDASLSPGGSADLLACALFLQDAPAHLPNTPDLHRPAHHHNEGLTCN